MRADRRGGRGAAAGGVVAGLHRLQPRRRPARHALGGRRPASARALALLMLLTLRGTPFLYYGDEIGAARRRARSRRRARPGAAAHGRPGRNRDTCRTPMQWSAEPGAGFTDGGVEPWLPFGDTGAHNVADQRDDPGSTLHLVRDLIALRRERADLTRRRLRDAARARRRVGVAARRRHVGGAEPVRRARRRSRASRARSRSPPTARATARRSRRRSSSRRGRASVDRCRSTSSTPLLSEEGWVYASTPPVAEGDPGRYHALFGRDSLITALQVLPARPDVARGDAARARRAAGRSATTRRSTSSRARSSTSAAPAAPAVAHRARLAGARRRAALLRLGRLDLVVPRGARGARRRRAGRASSSRRGGRPARGSSRRSSRRRPRPLRPARGPGGLTQQGWRDVMGPAEQARRRRDPAARRLDAGAAARRRRRRRRSPTRRCARSRSCSARRRLDAPRRGARAHGSRPTSAPA